MIETETVEIIRADGSSDYVTARVETTDDGATRYTFLADFVLRPGDEIVFPA